MTWVCNNCYSAMDVTEENSDRYRIECPTCGTVWYVDDEDEMINDGSSWSPNDEDDDEDGEYLDVYDAAEIWLSHGKDEDYTFGYTEEELEDAL